ncbi:sensor histidine kinase [Adhaeribacter aquaticus]|uniref:sensor histidine kinase n=1 Tax=Adhaeribacter aquaticus TaxID=299567 RepID=UPI0004245710|nr:sensor histidine kinase [Adhaeribacter aquaticus]
MTIRNRLTIIFTCLMAGFFLLVGIFIYILIANYTQKEFYERLQERASIAAQIHLEQDELSKITLDKIQQKFMQKLPREEVQVLNKNHKNWQSGNTKESENLKKLLNSLEKNTYKTFKFGNRQGVAIYYPDNQGDFYIVVQAQDVYGKSKLTYLRNILLLSFVVGILGMALVGRVASNQALNPITDIIKKVNKIQITNLDLRLNEGNGQDELAQLSITFNQMLERLETAFETQKHFISNASHELRNPLTAIAGEIEVTLTRVRSQSDYQESLERLQLEVERLEKLTKDLLNLAQTDYKENPNKTEVFRIDEILLEVQEEVKKNLSCPPIKLSFENFPETAEVLEIKGSPNLFRSAMSNIIENACKFSNGKEILLKLIYDKTSFTILVQDNGIGIPADEIKNVKEPFYRARNARGVAGTGIGLSLTDKIVRQHNGTLQIESEPGKGTKVSIHFPLKTV